MEVGDDHQPLDVGDLELSASTRALIVAWMELAREDAAHKHEAIVLAGIRSADALAREFGFERRVNFAMADPREGGSWLSVDLVRPR